MKRRFLDGWTFLETPYGTSFHEVKETRETPMKDSPGFSPVELPHDWLIGDSSALYRDSTGWYRNAFTIPDYARKRLAGKRFFIIFDGIYMDSRVYLNGREIGAWKYGYTRFSLEITDFLREGENLLMVGVNFRAPNSRWYSGAGINRNVYFSEKEETFFPEDGLYVSAKKEKEGTFLLKTSAEIEGSGKARAEVSWTLREPTGREIPLESSEDGGVFHVSGVRSWDVEDPCLYSLTAVLTVDGREMDRETLRIGFRDIRFDPDRGLLLNGRQLKIHGVCEHPDFGALGSAFRRAAALRKIHLLKEMGVNAIRGAHGPVADEMLDLCDEEGILFLSEGFDMWESSKNPWDYARFFKEWQEKDTASWIRRDRNHPCVFLWSIGNEIYDTHASRRGAEITRMLAEEVRALDKEGNASPTLCSNYMPWENAQNCADILKIVGYNYGEKYYETHHREHPDWVIFGSETSSIVASRGIYHFPLSAPILSEDDFQCSALGNSLTSWGAKSLEACIAIDRDSPYSMGQFLWSGFDYIGEPTPYHTKNSYFGQLDTAGFPKDSYYVFQAAFTDGKKKPMVHVFPYWDFNPGQEIDVRVCANTPAVELFLNGRSLGRQALSHDPGSGSHLIADFRLPYEKGVLTARGIGEDGTILAEESRHSFGNSHAIRISADRETARYGKDLLFAVLSTVDRDGNPVENAVDWLTVQVTGAGRLIGLDNGDSTDSVSYQSASKRLFSGKLLAILAPDRVPGKIFMRVSGRGLIPAEAVFTCLGDEEEGTVQSALRSCRAKAERKEQKQLTGTEQGPENASCPSEIPVRKITLIPEGGRRFDPDTREITVSAFIDPPEASDRELIFRAVSDKGIDSNLVSLRRLETPVTREKGMPDASVRMRALGDGSFNLRCESKSGTEIVRVISQLSFRAEGLGQAYLDPYSFVSAGLYSGSHGEVSPGNEKGIASARDGETWVLFSGMDFGPVGSDEVTIPIFALTNEEYPLEIYRGTPDEGELICRKVYQREVLWNRYQEESFHLRLRLKKQDSFSILMRQKVHIKGFTFRKLRKGRIRLMASEADQVYGDSFHQEGTSILGIGNNVSLCFSDCDFGPEGISAIRISGKTPLPRCTIHIQFAQEEAGKRREDRTIVEFEGREDPGEQSFQIPRHSGTWDVTFVFLPGSAFDFDSFQFF